jgi:hydroxypyruvate isomerase
MPRFAANITFLFTELPLMARFAAAAQAGFRGVEFHYPYEFESYAIREQLDVHGLTPVLMNIRAGDHKAGEWGFAGVPGREETFRMCVAEAINYAADIGVRQLNCLAGVRSPGVIGLDASNALVANLRYAAAETAKAGIALNLEPINTIDVPGYLVATSDYALDIIARTGAPNLRLQYDWYHMQMMGEPLAGNTQQLLPHIGHIQFADSPGRHEPGTGTIDFVALFELLDAIGYAGWVSAEYRPLGRTEDSLGWMRR